MVFGRFMAGFACGLFIPQVCHHNIHYTIASGFLTPHLRYQARKEKRESGAAVPVQELDSYMMDVIKSFGLFWIMIGPTIYFTYFTDKDPFAENSMEEKIY